jgi:pyruvate dehydrogenase (quinone)
LLGLRGLRVEDPADVDDAWKEAFTSDRPFVLQAVVEPDAPLLPPFPAGAEKLASMRAGLEQEGESGRQAHALLEAHAAQESGAS